MDSAEFMAKHCCADPEGFQEDLDALIRRERSDAIRGVAVSAESGAVGEDGKHLAGWLHHCANAACPG